MPLATPNRDGGSTNERGILRSVGRMVDGNVQSGFRVRQNSPLGMSVRIGGESGTPDDLLIRNTAYNYTHPVFIDDGIAIEATVATANASNPRIDLVVVYIDYAETPDDTYSNNTNGVIKTALIEGLAATVPYAPSHSDILAAIGASNYYVTLAQINVPAGATTITDSMITDSRVFTSLPADSVDTQAITANAVPPEKWTNPYSFSVYRESDQTGIPDATPTVIQFATEFADYNSNFNTSTYTYTVPVAGLYEFSAFVFANGTGISDTYLELYVNSSSSYRFARIRTGSATESNQGIGGSIRLALSAGDTVQARAFINVSSGTATVKGTTGGTGGDATFFSGALVHAS